MLEVLGCGGRVVVQADQRIVHALGREQGERPVGAGQGHMTAVGDGIVDARQVGQREDALQVADMRVGDVRARLVHGKGQRDRPVADADFQGPAVVAQQQVELFAVVVGKQGGARQRRGVAARRGQEAVGQQRPRDRQRAVALDRDIGIEGRRRRAGMVTAGEGGKTRHQRGACGIVEFGDAGERGIGIGETFHELVHAAAIPTLAPAVESAPARPVRPGYAGTRFRRRVRRQ
jgi:hypothetical protein